ncbi:MAG: ribonuclease J [Thiotrichales bacterium]|nr:ribonuclease J [Thiotrichales bacterium]
MPQSPALQYACKNDFWFLPLGGTGEIGMNMNLYGHNKQWLMVDCGMGFLHEGNSEKRITADPAFIEQQIERLQAIVLTHAHEDHLGALVELWPRLKVPVYATSFAAELLLNKLSAVTWGHAVPIYTVPMQSPQQIGDFEVTWLPMPHSIPEASSLLIETQAAKVLHSGDWKMDANPVVGPSFNRALYGLLHSYELDALICDATNATKSGHTLSESACYQGLYQAIAQAPQRVVVSCFSSNIARLVTLAKIAKKTGRKMALFGRSMETMVGIARRLGYWPNDLILIDPKHIGFLPAKEVLVVATGSQGEPRAALTKLSYQRHPWLYLEEGDRVIFSAIKIPPNKVRIEQLLERLRRQKLDVIHAEEQKGTPLHASGHPSQDDLEQFLSLVHPKALIPTHGEAEHLQALAELAQKQHIPTVMAGTNGDLFKIAPFYKIEKHFAKTGSLEILS